MTDRGKQALRRDGAHFTVGPSSLSWDANAGELHIDINEISAPPMISRVRGRVKVKVPAITGVEMPLTQDGAHIWRPFAPTARINVDLEATGWQWDGHGYLDANFGTRALEADFDTWMWGRFPHGDGSVCFYDANRRDGSRLAKAVSFDKSGAAQEIATPPPLVPFRRGNWGVKRLTRADAGTRPRQVLPMLDAPFYCRSAVQTQIDGQRVTGVHEALDLRVFRTAWLMPMLAVRVPRRAGWRF